MTSPDEAEVDADSSYVVYAGRRIMQKCGLRLYNTRGRELFDSQLNVLLVWLINHIFSVNEQYFF